MNLRIEKEVNDGIVNDQNDKTFNDFIIDFTPANKKTFSGIIKNEIYKTYGDTKTDFNYISKKTDLEILDFVFKKLNDHQLKVYINNCRYIDKKNFTTQLEDYKNRFVKESKGA